MDKITLLRERLNSLSGSQTVKLAADAGVPYNTILNIKKGVVADPRVSTYDALIAGLRKVRPKASA